MQIGVGLEGPAYWSRGENPFIDQMKWRGGWISFNATGSSPWDTQLDQEIPLDANGYPDAGIPYATSGGLQKVRMVISASERIPSQRQYVFLYDGYGDFSFHGGWTVDSVAAGRIVATLTGTGNVWMHIDSSAPAPHHARNFRLVPLAEELTYEEEMFRPPFLEKLAPFYAIRFMDWFHTNNSPVQTWAMRSTPQSYSQADSAGVCHEYAIELCNRTQKHPWVTVPHLADSLYITEMARLWHDSLDPSLDVWLEYSNETWNWQFAQAQWIIQQTGAYPAHWPLNTEYNPNQNFAWNSGIKSKRIFRIWRQVWGADSLRVQRVLGTQGAWPQAVAYGNIEGADYQYDYLCPTWYFGISPSEANAFPAGTTPEQVIDTCRKHFFVDGIEDFKLHYQIVDSFGGKVAHYEGGQHISAYGNTGAPALQAFYDAQNHPQMYQLYDDVLDSLRDWGSELAMAFVLGGGNSQYGSWGHIPSVDSTASFAFSPKYMALLDNLLPAPIPQLGSDTTICQGQSLLLAPGNFLNYDWSTGSSAPTLTATTSGTYAVSVTDANGCTASDSLVLGVDVCTWIDPAGHFEVQVFPNPARELLRVRTPDANCPGLRVAIVDGLGRTVVQREFSGQAGEIQLGSLGAGNYMVRVENCLGTASLQIIHL